MMATHHANDNEVVDLKTWTADLPFEKSKVIVKAKEFEMARLYIEAGNEFKEHKVSGPITVQCIEGEIEFTANNLSQTMKPGQLLHLKPGEPHSLKAVSNSIILLTIIFIK
jgi:quercetin dioxygenase-like cupin family protein